MDNSKDLQTALNQFNVFYKNVNELIESNKKESKKLFGHSIFKKSESPLFNFIESSLLCVGTTVGCAALKMNDLLPYDFFISASIGCVATGVTAIVLNNVIYHINNHIGGPIGRTYAHMQSDNYFDCIKYFIKKDHQKLLDKDLTDSEKLEHFISFADTLNNCANNLQIDYEKVCKRVSKYSAKEQKKWEPVLKHIEEYSLYLLNNAEKFNVYAEKLQEKDNSYLIEDKEKLQNLEVTNNKKHSSEYLEFKNHLKHKANTTTLNKQKVNGKEEADLTL